MRVLLVTSNFPPEEGGIATHSLAVARHLSELGDDVIVIAPGGRGSHEADPTLGFKVYRLSPFRSKYLRLAATFLYTLVAVMRHRPVDCLYSTHWRSCGVAVWLVSVFSRVPYFQAVHGSEVLPKNLGRGMRRAFSLVASRARKLIALGDYQRLLLVRLGIPESNIEVLPEGVSLEWCLAPRDPGRERIIRRKHGLEGKKVLLTVGRLVPRKGHDMVIRALPAVLEKVPQAVYVIVGRGPEEARLRQLARQLGVEERVVFTGYVPDGELVAYYDLCDVFVMVNRDEPNDVEGFGIAFIEACARGKPVIGGRSGGATHAVVDGITGLLVDPYNVKEIGDSLIEVLTNGQLAAILGGNGRRRAEQELSYRVIVHKLREVMSASLRGQRETSAVGRRT
jgi:phosphatidylinositol alpha-1,6-mannosyltransferase